MVEAAAALAPASLRGSAFGLLASTLAGVLWTAVSPAAAFLFLAGAMTVAVPLILVSIRIRQATAGN